MPLTCMTPESNEPSLAVTVWFDGPALVQVTALPRLTVAEGGVKLKSPTRMSPLPATTVSSAAAVGCAAVAVANGVSTVEFGTAGPEVPGVGFGPGVEVDEVTIGRLAAGPAFDAVTVAPHDVRTSTSPVILSAANDLACLDG